MRVCDIPETVCDSLSLKAACEHVSFIVNICEFVTCSFRSCWHEQKMEFDSEVKDTGIFYHLRTVNI